MNIKHLLEMEAAGISLNAKCQQQINEHRASLIQEDECNDYSSESSNGNASVTENVIRTGVGFGIGYLIGRNL